MKKTFSRNILLECLSVHIFLKYGLQLSGMGIMNKGVICSLMFEKIVGSF